MLDKTRYFKFYCAIIIWVTRSWVTGSYCLITLYVNSLLAGWSAASLLVCFGIATTAELSAFGLPIKFVGGLEINDNESLMHPRAYAVNRLLQ